MRVEDHALDYGPFEGTIAAGSYGAGTVMLWDRGHWSPAGDAEAMLAAGSLRFDLFGTRMRGAWTLRRMRAGGRGENWLLRKVADAHAHVPDDLTARFATSLASGRTIEQVASGLDASLG